MAQCPAHADRTPSLSIMSFPDGNVWLHCFAGCETDDVLDRLGLSYADLFTSSARADVDGPDMVPGKELPPAWANPLARAVLDVLHDHAFNGQAREAIGRAGAGEGHRAPYRPFAAVGSGAQGRAWRGADEQMARSRGLGSTPPTSTA
jgi:hypothetical protein